LRAFRDAVTPPTLTVEQRQRYEQALDAELLVRFRWALPVGLVIAVAIGVVGSLGRPAH
jgi:hypothetical protein